MTDEAALTIINPATPAEFKERHNDLIKFVKSQLRESKNIAGGESGDYGIIPYTKKKSLLKPGAEKLLKLFGLAADNVCIKEVEDFQNRFVIYKYKCTITHMASGKFVAAATRSCNNKEKKHSTKDVYDVANTIDAVAQKRALVAATIQATMASEIFDADVSDNDEEAPGRTVTKEEDPRRNRVTMGLYGTAKRHGWDDDWIHRAIKKKWDIDSLKDCSNDQIEMLKEFIEEKYEEVDQGEKPRLRGVPVDPSVTVVQGDKVETITEVPANDDLSDMKESIEGEVVDPHATCANCKKKYLPEDVVDLDPEFAIYYCSQKCKEEYYPPKEDSKKEPWKEGFGKKNKTGATS